MLALGSNRVTIIVRLQYAEYKSGTVQPDKLGGALSVVTFCMRLLLPSDGFLGGPADSPGRTKEVVPNIHYMRSSSRPLATHSKEDDGTRSLRSSME